MTAAAGEDAVLPDAGVDAAARGGLYGLLATAFAPPDLGLNDALADGSFEATVAELLARTTLDVEAPSLPADEDPDTRSAWYHDLFVVGYAEYEDRTDGTLTSTAPPVPRYESAYREDVSWGDVNLDLARAYDYYGLEIDTERRDHHDSLRLELEFAGYLARREAAVDDSAAAARLDFHDRHLRILVEGLCGRLEAEPGTGVYGPLAELLDAVTAADRDDLAARLEGDT